MTNYNDITSDLVIDFINNYTDMDFMDYNDTRDADYNTAYNTLCNALKFSDKYYHVESPELESRLMDDFKSLPELTRDALSFLCDYGIIQ